MRAEPILVHHLGLRVPQSRARDYANAVPSACRQVSGEVLLPAAAAIDGAANATGLGSLDMCL